MAQGRNLFQQLEIEAFRAGITPRTKQSIEWFRRKASQLGKVSIPDIMDEPELSKSSRAVTDTGPIGNMYMFQYDPKYRISLPYYDAFPLVIITGARKGGFIGMNLHYLPPILRAKFLDALMDNVTSKKSPDAKFKLTTRLLASASDLEYYKPCIKHYLNEHVRSNFAEVKAPEWEIATFLPTALFEKADQRKVYNDSRRMIR